MPPVPKYQCIWDPDTLLTYLQNMDINSPLYISMNTVSLFIISLGQRVNSISLMKVNYMYLTDSECTFVLDEALKHSRQGYQIKPFVLISFPDNEKLCSLTTLQLYLNFRLEKTSDEGLFITTQKPHQNVRTTQ